MKDHLKDLEVMKENLWLMRRRISENNKSIPWTTKKLEVVLKKLDVNK